ncbi:HBL310Wp [Eremothecium sinecaudum]|uniref:HBL310Wp n=1 Tax=Eremothecium sinecaudum TaxID=45286 RepID=A0A109UWS7_9SACH|nr:HBL310Wp [Eremothecium sinecaudum]AMD18592.1 HBL310Wp [Eremothecium sinecaudum]
MTKGIRNNNNNNNKNKSTGENIRRGFSVDDNVTELQYGTHFTSGVETSSLLSNKTRGDGIASGVGLQQTSSHMGGGLTGLGTGSIVRPSLEHKISKFSNVDDFERGGLYDGLRDLPPVLGDQESVKTIESYTLRERQAAINETHPFGIRIWKPALYKKQRSVQRAAEEDIHETNYKHVSMALHISNFVWTATVGLFLFLLLSIAGLMVLCVGFLTPSAREYSKVFFKLGRYLLWPFGKVVYIVSDEQYLQEDKDEGISMQQFYNWITSAGNRLFFHQSGTEMNSPLTFQRETIYGSLDGSFRGPATSSTPSYKFDDFGDIVPQRRLFGRGQWTFGRFVFYAIFHSFIQPLMLVLVTLTWLAVFTIPMSNIMWNLLYHCRRHPLALEFKHIRHTKMHNSADRGGSEKNVLLCTFRCAGWHYYKFTVDGTNIIVMNLIAIVFFTIIDFYVIKEYLGIDVWITNTSTIFSLCLLSIIPLAFYIGQAVASISAQTSMGVSAALNAFFSTILEVFVYCVALRDSKGPLVEGSMVGSILGAVLLLPGLSMCGGAIKRKTQRYNPASAGVSSAMLIFSMMVMFVPTLLYLIYGDWELTCRDVTEIALDIKQTCHFTQPTLKFDKMYLNVLRPISIICAIVLFMAYVIGLWFTLRTHAAMIWQLQISEHPSHHIPQQQQQQQQQQHAPQQPITSNSINKQAVVVREHSAPYQSLNSGAVTEPPKGHDAPNWSRQKSAWILLGSTVLYATIAEILVAGVDNVLKDFPSLSPKFLGLTVFALVPNTTEFLNAISFATHGNVALSMEIGTAYTLQVCLLQIPALVIYSLVYTSHMDPATISIRDQMFSLVFSRWDLIACAIASFLFTYLYAEGKSNYFKGSILILLYVVLVVGFYYQELLTDNFWDYLNQPVVTP